MPNFIKKKKKLVALKTKELFELPTSKPKLRFYPTQHFAAKHPSKLSVLFYNVHI